MPTFSLRLEFDNHMIIRIRKYIKSYKDLNTLIVLGPCLARQSAVHYRSILIHFLAFLHLLSFTLS